MSDSATGVGVAVGGGVAGGGGAGGMLVTTNTEMVAGTYAVEVGAGGTGTGKSQVCREIAYGLIKQNIKVGYIALEESVKRSLQGLVSIPLKK